MKKNLWVLIAVMLVGLLTTACQGNPAGKGTSAETAETTELTEVTETTEKLPATDYELLYSDDAFQVIRSKQTLDELKRSVLYQQPDDLTVVKESDSEFLVRWGQGADTLYSKEVFGEDGKLLDDVFVVVVEQKKVNDHGGEFTAFYPYHMTAHHWTLSEAESGYTFVSSDHDPFAKAVELKPGASVFTDLAQYYRDHGCEVREEGDDQNGGTILVTMGSDSAKRFQILVAADGSDSFTMRCSLPEASDSQQVSP